MNGTTPAGTASSDPLLFYGAPHISSFNPTHGFPGTSVTISGTNFLDTTVVRFDGFADRVGRTLLDGDDAARVGQGVQEGVQPADVVEEQKGDGPEGRTRHLEFFEHCGEIVNRRLALSARARRKKNQARPAVPFQLAHRLPVRRAPEEGDFHSVLRH